MAKENYISEALLKDNPKAALSLVIKDGSVTAQKLANGSVTKEKIASNSITVDKIAANSITGEKIAKGAITSDLIVDFGITSDKIADKSILTRKLTDNAVTEDKIAEGSVTTYKIGNRSVTGIKIAKETVEAENIKDSAITTDKVKDRNITTEKLADKSVINDKLADNAVTHDKIKANEVVWDNLESNVQNAIKLNYGLVTLDADISDVYSKVEDSGIILKVNTISDDDIEAMLKADDYDIPEVVPDDTGTDTDSTSVRAAKAIAPQFKGVIINKNNKQINWGLLSVNQEDSDMEMQFVDDKLIIKVKAIPIEAVDAMLKEYNYAV